MTIQLTRQERIELAHVVMAVLDAWRIEDVARITLLGLPASTKPRSLKSYREEEPLPEEQNVLQRAESLLSIHDILYTTFPHNIAMAHRWVSTPNKRFSNATPLSIMLAEGMEGLQRIRSHLDCTQNWF